MRSGDGAPAVLVVIRTGGICHTTTPPYSVPSFETGPTMSSLRTASRIIVTKTVLPRVSLFSRQLSIRSTDRLTIQAKLNSISQSASARHSSTMSDHSHLEAAQLFSCKGLTAVVTGELSADSVTEDNGTVLLMLF